MNPLVESFIPFGHAPLAWRDRSRSTPTLFKNTGTSFSAPTTPLFKFAEAEGERPQRKDYPNGITEYTSKLEVSQGKQSMPVRTTSGPGRNGMPPFHLPAGVLRTKKAGEHPGNDSKDHALRRRRKAKEELRDQTR